MGQLLCLYLPAVIIETSKKNCIYSEIEDFKCLWFLYMSLKSGAFHIFLIQHNVYVIHLNFLLL